MIQCALIYLFNISFIPLGNILICFGYEPKIPFLLRNAYPISFDLIFLDKFWNLGLVHSLGREQFLK